MLKVTADYALVDGSEELVIVSPYAGMCMCRTVAEASWQHEACSPSAGKLHKLSRDSGKERRLCALCCKLLLDRVARNPKA